MRSDATRSITGNDVEDGVGEDRRTPQDAGQHAGFQTRRVEERIDDEVTVTPP